MRFAQRVSRGDGARRTLIVTAHGSADPRSAGNTHAVVDQVRRLRPGLDVRAAFLERSTPNVRDVLAALAREDRRDAVVAPLLLADAYHARVDIPDLIAESGAQRRGLRVRQADVLGEDDRLVAVLRERLAQAGVSRLDGELGVLLVAVGSTRERANGRTAALAPVLAAHTRWAGASAAFATGPHPTLDEASHRLRQRGATRLVIAPWFLAPGRLTDRIDEYAREAAIPMARPLGAHRLVAATVLDRFDRALSRRAAA
jgi:sirohydrochlorin ferrochelatase